MELGYVFRNKATDSTIWQNRRQAKQDMRPLSFGVSTHVGRTVHWWGHLFSSVVHQRSSPPYQWQQPSPIFFLIPLYSLHFIVPLGDLELVAVPASSLSVRYKVCCWGFTKPYFGHNQAGTHTGPPHHVERQQTCSSHGHSWCRSDIAPQLRLEAGPAISYLGNEENPRVLEKSFVVVQPVWAHLPELSHPLSPQDLLDSQAPLPNARWAAWAQRAARCGNEWAGYAGGNPNHVLQNAIIYRVDLVVDVELVRAAGEEV